jgi:hypothetical protein
MLKIISPTAISLLYNVKVTTLNTDYTDIFSNIYSLTKCNSPKLTDVNYRPPPQAHIVLVLAMVTCGAH